jgi:hypothetical protein
MATVHLFKETGVMEGACGKITEEGDGTVVKQVHRHLKHRAKCHGAQKQCEIQQWAAQLLTPENGFRTLFVPKAWGAQQRQYRMEKIDCAQEVAPAEVEELKLFYAKAKEVGIFPCDYELYRQADGRVAMIDFDKFAAWKGNAVLFPWGLVWATPIYPWS